jgi:putative SOS response-associated peptidase YedK
MCGRYSADNKANDWIKEYCSLPSEGVLRVGDIRPGERAPVIIAGESKPLIVPMIWGIQGNGSLIINARKETLWEKPTFRNLIQNRRCLLPASCFYEWDSGKHKVTLYGKDDNMLFLAGVYQAAPDGGRFVIITAPADEIVKPIHDRMPVRIPEALIDEWLSNPERTREILEMASTPLRREQTVEQLSLWEE